MRKLSGLTLALCVTGTISAAAAPDDSRRARLERQLQHQQTMRLPTLREGAARAYRLLVREFPDLGEQLQPMLRGTLGAQRSRLHDARRALGQVRQQLRIAQLPPRTLAEIRRTFAQVQHLHLTLSEGHSRGQRPGEPRTNSVVFMGQSPTGDTIALSLEARTLAGGARPSVQVRRRVWRSGRSPQADPDLSVSTAYVLEGPCLVKRSAVERRRQQGWNALKTFDQLLDAATGKPLSSARSMLTF